MNSRARKKTGIKNVVATALLLAIGGVFLAPLASEAYQPAPQNTEIRALPMMVPFRVWVMPSTEGGAMRSGYYKYVQLEMTGPEAETLKTPGLTPAVAPIYPSSGDAAIPTM